MNDDVSALISAVDLQQQLQQKTPLLLIDLCSDEHYACGHIPGAVHIKPSQLSCGIKPSPGKLPEQATLQQLFQSIGLQKDTPIVVYDDAGSSWAGRMVWTLALIGQHNVQLLDGGRYAWEKAGFDFSQDQVSVQKSDFNLSIDSSNIANIDEIQSQLNHNDFMIWDARSLAEYDGSKILAKRGGHIPGATHLEWTDLTDNEGFLLDTQQLQTLLNSKGLSADKHIVTHCQTHRRSGLTWFVAKKLLSYPQIKAYPGSWSEWGNDDTTQIEMETFKTTK